MSDSFETPWTWPAGLLCPWDSPGENTGVDLPFPSPGSFDPGIKPGSLALEADSLPSELQGKSTVVLVKEKQCVL